MKFYLWTYETVLHEFHILHILRKKLRNKIKNASLKDIEKMLTKFFELWQEKKKV